MPRRVDLKEGRIRFYQQWNDTLAPCASKRYSDIRQDPFCKRIIAAAREHLGYSPKTSAVDVYTAVMRGYLKHLKEQGEPSAAGRSRA